MVWMYVVVVFRRVTAWWVAVAAGKVVLEGAVPRTRNTKVRRQFRGLLAPLALGTPTLGSDPQICLEYYLFSPHVTHTNYSIT